MSEHFPFKTKRQTSPCWRWFPPTQIAFSPPNQAKGWFPYKRQTSPCPARHLPVKPSQEVVPLKKQTSPCGSPPRQMASSTSCRGFRCVGTPTQPELRGSGTDRGKPCWSSPLSCVPSWTDLWPRPCSRHTFKRTKSRRPSGTRH